MKTPAPFDIVTIGHLAIDIIKSSNIRTPKPTLGGPPTYVSAAATKLGAKVSIISKVGNDFSDKHMQWLRKNNIDLSGLERVLNASTTRFILEYKNSKRKLQLQTRASPIRPLDIPDSLKAEIIHVAPIANEIAPTLIPELHNCAEVLSLDPQGFVRSFDAEGNVGLQKWMHPEVLARIDIFKSAVEEIRAMTGVKDLGQAMRQISNRGIKIVIVTLGTKGSLLLSEGQFQTIPACKPRAFVDPTGAGDAFIGGFLAEYTRGKDVSWCACIGSAAASFVVEGLGPEKFGEKHEVYERANRIYEKVTQKN